MSKEKGDQYGIHGAVRASIVLHRAEAGLSVRGFAARLGVAPGLVCQWERGRQSGLRHLYHIWLRGPLPASDLARAILAGPLAGMALDIPTQSD